MQKNIIPPGYTPIQAGDKKGEYLIGESKEVYSFGRWGVNIYDKLQQREFLGAVLVVKEPFSCPFIRLQNATNSPVIALYDNNLKGRYLINTRRVKKLFVIPIVERFVEASPAILGRNYCYPVVVTAQDETKIPLNFYSKEKIEDPGSFDFEMACRRILIGLRNTALYVVDKETEEDAIKSIEEWKYYGGDIGAIWKDPKAEVKLIESPHMHLNSRGGIICGRPYITDNGDEHGEHADGCIIDSYEPGPNCPVVKEREEMYA